MSRETDGWVARCAMVARRLRDHPDDSPRWTPPGNYGSERQFVDDQIPADAGLVRTDTGAKTTPTGS
jgi:hypothetical protein